MKTKENLLQAIRAGLFHFVASLVIAGIVAVFMFGLWYPDPTYRLLQGMELFLLVMGVDVVCGPMLTTVLFDKSKPRRQLAFDLSFVVLIQVAALGYGIFAVLQARPIYIVFEVDRFRVVTFADVEEQDWATASAPWNQVPKLGPRWITVREAKTNEEKLSSIDLAMSGKDTALRPDWWMEWSVQTPEAILKRAKTISDLRQKLEISQLLILDDVLANAAVPEESLRSLPITSFRTTNWVALIDSQTAKPVAYAPVDGF